MSADRCKAMIGYLNDAGVDINRRATTKWEKPVVEEVKLGDKPGVRVELWGETVLETTCAAGCASLKDRANLVAEALTNAIVHGSPHGADDDIRVRFFCYDDEVAVEVADGGGGLDATPIRAPEASQSSGRGIHFMRALCDAVQFTCGPLGTQVLLVKRRS